MRTFSDDRQLLHAPERELHNGEWVPYAECPSRMASIAARCAAEPAADFGLEPILAVHDAAYVEFLRSAHDEWLAAGRAGDAIGYAFPVVRRRALDLQRIDAKIGQFSFDASTPIAQHTWQSAYWSAQSALSALDAVAGGEPRAFALCRPPGHHAGADYMGGYCYLNNAAIVARRASAMGLGPVAILDVDYHHGNGTQDIFYADGDVFFASIHADPVTDYPFFWGHADETGEGEGAGSTLNLPLPRGTGWAGYEPALGRALEAIAHWGAKFLVVSFGADTFADDPISHFRLVTADYRRIAERIAGLGLPTVIAMEGGYAVDALAANVEEFLGGFG
ncbi:histone deacetylase family protein [Tsuneonella mangrovi]|uniref:histone deacetylase family protein n=1 Tax=Tsuneonella mangrovi TaxID=1982042 RepID=UPI000BA2B0F0|nr:histone deacetylase family protein [Tsuneonella mangrovi]